MGTLSLASKTFGVETMDGIDETVLILEVAIGFGAGEAEEDISSKYLKSLVKGFEARGKSRAGMLSLSS